MSGVLLSRDHVSLPAAVLLSTPSQKDGLPVSVEAALRASAVDVICQAGILLDLPQTAMSTAAVLFHRYYYKKSFVTHKWEDVAAAAVCLAAKIEENQRRLKDIIIVFHFLRQHWTGATEIKPINTNGNKYHDRRQDVERMERKLLYELGFCVHVQHPYKLVINYLMVMGCITAAPALAPCAWNYLNDSYRTNVSVRFTPYAVACACIYLASSRENVALPNNPPWWLLFDASTEDVEEAAKVILSLYTLARPSILEMESILDDALALKRTQPTPDVSECPTGAMNSPRITSPSNAGTPK